MICFPGLPLQRRNAAKLIFCWDAQKRRQTYTSTSCCSRKLAVFAFITSFLFLFFFSISLAGAPSPHAWWLDPRLKIPIINLHHDKLRKCGVFSSSFPLVSLPLPALSFIPHKHMRYGAVLMRTEWTDPRPRCHWGPPLQIRHRYQFSSVLFKRPQCGIPNASALCSTIPSHIPPKAPIMPFSVVTLQKCWCPPFFTCPPGNFSNAFFLQRICREIADNPNVDHNADIPFDASSPRILWLCSPTCSWPQIILKSWKPWSCIGCTWKRHGHTCRH